MCVWFVSTAPSQLNRRIRFEFFNMFGSPFCAVPTGEKATTAMTPSFNGKSFIVLRNWDQQQRGAGSQELTIDIEFRPSTTSGILLYGAQQEDGRGDFVSLALNDGRVEFRWAGTFHIAQRSQKSTSWTTLSSAINPNTLACLWANLMALFQTKEKRGKREEELIRVFAYDSDSMTSENSVHLTVLYWRL